MFELAQLAAEVGISERTLRRAAGRGLVRTVRERGWNVAVPPQEREYVRSHWALIGRLLEALRKQPGVRLAVVFGSVARGDEHERSDLDLLVRLRRDDYIAHADLADALEAVVGRRVQLVSLEQAADSPLLLADMLRDGRVLIDRDGDWPRLRRRERQIARQAQEQDELFERLAWELLTTPPGSSTSEGAVGSR
jgi:predicted nucleotidyltransferase